MDKPTKPSNLMPRSFGGVKNNFSASLQSSGYEDGVPAVYGGDNVNYQLDTTGKELDYCEKIVDFIVDMPIGKTITVDGNNKIVYQDLGANTDLSNLTSTGKAKIAIKEYSISETYELNDVVMSIIDEEVKLFKSLANENIGNLLTDTTKWEEVELGGGGSSSTLTPFSLNNGNVDSSGKADILNAPGSGTVSEYFTLPNFTSNSDYGYTISGLGDAGYGSYYMLYQNYNTDSGAKLNKNQGGTIHADLTFPAGQSAYITKISTPKYSYSLGYGMPSTWQWRVTMYRNNVQVFQQTYSGLNIGHDITAVEVDKIVIDNILSNNPDWVHCSSFKFEGYKIVSVSTADTLYFNVGGAYPRLTATTGNGVTFTKNFVQEIDISNYANGTYNCFISDSTAELLSNTIYRQANQPLTPSNGDVWFNTQEPTSAYKYSGSAWIDYDGVPIGKIIITGGVITKVVQSDFASATKIFTSGMAMPSTTYEYLTVGASGTSYTAPADGWVKFSATTNNSNQFVQIQASMTGLTVASGTLNVDTFIPIRKGETFTIYYTAPNNKSLVFYYAIGSESEAS